MKKIIILTLLIIVIPVGWWLISPLFINVEVNEMIPSISKKEHDKQKALMKDKMVLDSKVDMPKLKDLGTFVDGDTSHKVSGKVLLYKDKEQSILRLEDLDATNGPDLYVVLSTKINPKTGDVGEIDAIAELKGNQGNQNYPLKNMNIDNYKSVIIYCKAFSVVFGYATIK